MLSTVRTFGPLVLGQTLQENTAVHTHLSTYVSSPFVYCKDYSEGLGGAALLWVQTWFVKSSLSVKTTTETEMIYLQASENRVAMMSNWLKMKVTTAANIACYPYFCFFYGAFDLTLHDYTVSWLINTLNTITDGACQVIRVAVWLEM